MVVGAGKGGAALSPPVGGYLSGGLGEDPSRILISLPGAFFQGHGLR